MSTRCKFITTQKTENVNGFEIVTGPVYDGSPENKEFYKHTPAGELRFSTVNKSCAREFKPGQEFYLDITQILSEDDKK